MRKPRLRKEILLILVIKLLLLWLLWSWCFSQPVPKSQRQALTQQRILNQSAPDKE